MGQPLEAVYYSEQVGGYIACSRQHLDRLYIIPEALYQIHWEHWVQRFASVACKEKLAHLSVMQHWQTGMCGIVEVPVDALVLE